METATQTAATTTAKTPTFQEQAAQFSKELVAGLRSRLTVISQSLPAKRSSNQAMAMTEVFNHRVMQLNALQTDGLERVHHWAGAQSAPRHLVSGAQRQLDDVVNRLYESTKDAWRARLRQEQTRLEARCESRPVEEFKPETVRPIRVGLVNSAAADASALAAAVTRRSDSLANARPTPPATGHGASVSKKGRVRRWWKKPAGWADPPKAKSEAAAKPAAGKGESLTVSLPHRLPPHGPARLAPAAKPAREPGQRRKPTDAERCTHEHHSKGRCWSWRTTALYCARHDPAKKAQWEANRLAAVREAANQRRAARGLPPLGCEQAVVRQPRAVRPDAPPAPRRTAVKAACGEALLPLVGRSQSSPGSEACATEPMAAAGKRGAHLPPLTLQPAAGETVERAAGKFAAGIETYFRKKAAKVCELPPVRFDVVAAGKEAATAVATRLREVRKAALDVARARCQMHIDLWSALHPGNQHVATYAEAALGLVSALYEQYDQSFARALARDTEAIANRFAKLDDEAHEQAGEQPHVAADSDPPLAQ